MNIIRRILSLASANRGRTGGAPAGRRGLGRRRTQQQPKATGLAALRGLLRR
ncbi:hypothetical protein [Patulibacter sp.]|uniref:hypothetical protein n=1 Tax=Patulibacter sp. TaxID=1912859 RepID=UPI002720850D|nr:hypothetical protein [Patulibacter sp.]MDO9408471.1 hypothetical protein [Patulibacter sp.]